MAEAFFAFLQRLFYLFAVSDIQCQPSHKFHLAFGVVQGEFDAVVPAQTVGCFGRFIYHQQPVLGNPLVVALVVLGQCRGEYFV